MFVEMEVLCRTLPICSVGEDRRGKQEVHALQQPSSSFTSDFASWHTRDAHEAMGKDGELHCVELSAEGTVRV